jgi:hypothetical protein
MLDLISQRLLLMAYRRDVHQGGGGRQ